MQAMLIDLSSLSKMPGKRLLEHCRHQSCDLPPNFKRLKVDAIRQFPGGCGAQATAIREGRTEGVTSVATTPNSKNKVERADVPVKPTGISAPAELKSKTMEVPVSCDKVEAVGQKMTLNNVGMKLPNGLASELEHGAQTRQADAVGGLETLSPPPLHGKKYPAPKIRKGVAVLRQFPPHCGKVNHVNNVEMKLPKASGKDGLMDVLENGAQPKQTDALCSLETLSPPLQAKKYPPPKIQKGVPVFRQFPPHCGKINHVSNVEMKLPMASEKDGLMNVLENGAPPMQADALGSLETLSPPALHAKKYPPPKIRKGVPVFRQFPPHCGKINHVNNVGMKLPKTSEKDGLTNVLESGAKPKQIDASSSVEMKLPKASEKDRLTNVLVSGAQPKQNDASSSLEMLSPQFFAAPNGLGIIPFDKNQSVVSRNIVMVTLNLFREVFEKLSQERQPNSKRQGKAAKQIHVEAAMVLKKQQKWVNSSEPILGPVPGVEVGDQFRFRVELVIIGLHQQFVAGIDYRKKDEKIYATSIVASGRYGNHAESSDVLIYSGQGGNPLVVNKKPEDQKLEKGNLALKNSMDARTPVRVIIGQQQNLRASNIKGTSNERIAKTYIYDGLYLVTKYWQERKKFGKLVYMFQLNRLSGQPRRGAWQIANKPEESKVHKDFCVACDISQGEEKIPVNAVIAMDDEKPPPFNYITNMIYPELHNHSSPVGCDCINGCSDSKNCSCIVKNGGEIPFNNNGAIIRAKPFVYECGPSCKCPPSCKNRVSQHGIRYQLEVFKTKLRGWGVRSRNYISSGSFICEYVGELLRDKEAEKRTSNDEYLFDIGIDYDDHILQDEDDDGYTIDAAHHGNVGRFINHSCSPNLYAQKVLYDHDDKRMCHIMLFATRNIPPLRELTYDYNYKVDQVRDVNGNVKMKKCYCGSRECTGRMY